jgi:two-component system, sensor histidine kinase and response regulator
VCDIVGYVREGLMTKTFGDITHPDDLEQDLTAMRRILAGEIDTFSMEKRYYRKDGSVVWANLTISLAVSMMRKADGSTDYFISIAEDISARKWARPDDSDSQQIPIPRFRFPDSDSPIPIH